jgi:hypothetical protein
MKMRRTLVLTAVLVALLSVGLAVPVSGHDPPPEPCIDLEKSCPETAMPGDTITYHYRLENCGDYDHKGAAQVYDPLFGPDPIWDNELPATAIVEFDKTYTLPEKCDPFQNHAWAIGHPWDPVLGKYLGDVRDDAWCTTDIKCPPPKCETELIAGKKYTAGVVEVWDDGTSLHLQYVADDWTIIDTQLYMSSTVPLKAAPGKFPYKGLLEYSVPLSKFDGNDVYIAAHAVVVSPSGKEETAWADSYGTLIRPKGSWALYFGYDPEAGVCFKP